MSNREEILNVNIKDLGSVILYKVNTYYIIEQTSVNRLGGKDGVLEATDNFDTESEAQEAFKEIMNIVIINNTY